MISFDLIGLFALSVMWVTTLLILAATASEAIRLSRQARALRPIGLALIGCTGILAAALGVSALALTAPYFGPWSTAGGALGLAYFLLVQPLGVMLRERMQIDRETGSFNRRQRTAG